MAKRVRLQQKPAEEKPKARGKKVDKPYADDSAALTDSFFGGMTDAYCSMTGDREIFTAERAESCISVIPFPSLCLEYLFAQNGYPLSRIMHLFGAQHSCKSAMACEIMRWHLQQGGMCAISETEGKDIPDLRASIIGNKDFLKYVYFSQDPGTDLWQDRVTKLLAAYRKNANGSERSKSGGMGRTMAFNITVDSVGAASMSEERTKIMEAGHASRAHPATALAIAQYMRTLPDQLIDYPISLTLINHQKTTTDSMGRPDFSTYGGRAVRFHASYELEMARKKFVRWATSGGVEIAFRMRKNGLGECDRRIAAKLVWLSKVDEATGNLRQYSYWDWHGATIELLSQLRDSSGAMKKKIDDVCDLKVVTGRRIWSDALGIPKTSALRFDEAGDILHGNKELVVELRKALGIHIRPTFEPGVDLLQQKEDYLKYKENYRTCPVFRMDDEADELIQELGKDKHKVVDVDE